MNIISDKLISQMTQLMKKQSGYRFYFIGATNFGFTKTYYDNNIYKLFDRLYLDGFVDDDLLARQLGRSIELETMAMEFDLGQMMNLIRTSTMFSFVEFEDTSHYLYNVITVKEAAQLLKISEFDVWESCEIGRFEARKADDSWLIDKKSLEPLFVDKVNEKGASAT